MSWTIGIDIGGTFTDCVCSSETGSYSGKAPTVRANPADSVMAAIAEVGRRVGATTEELLGDADVFVHGCTIGTNAVIERSGARVALLLTAGHEDVLRIGRLFQKVAGLSIGEVVHTSRLQRPRPLVEHGLTFGVPERLDRSGNVLVALDEAHVKAIAAQLREAQVDSVAVCYLWSFLSPEHERRTRELLQAELPGVEIALSSDIAPVIGEYERCVATVLNAYVNPAMRAYLEPLESDLSSAGFEHQLQIFDSGGGVTSARGALRMGVRTIDSGPVGGVVAAQTLGGALGRPNIICADMGGTSLDVAVIWDGRIEEEAQPTIDQYTFSVPRVAVKSIGAGGGSIAWIDDAGMLRVGPRSAGSLPGPVCYGRGGTAPTVTDANVILGALSREALLGGEMPIDHAAAWTAYAELAATLGEDVWSVARAVVTLVNSHMADLVRRVTLERGFDPRDFTMAVYGGAGPAHGVAIGREMGCGSVLFPDMASVFAASGMASCDVLTGADRFVAVSSPFDATAIDELRATIEELRADIAAELERDGHDVSRAGYHAHAAMRYSGQVAELPVDASWALTRDGGDLEADFTQLYRRTYGPGAVVDGARVDVARVRVQGRIPRGLVSNGAAAASDEPLRASGSRQVMFPDSAEMHDVPVIAAHASLRGAAGQLVEGPAIVERYGETIVIPPDHRGEVMTDGSLLVDLEASS
jgi:N-methylhydantoinase A